MLFQKLKFISCFVLLFICYRSTLNAQSENNSSNIGANTYNAFRISHPIKIDGKLEEVLWSTLEPILLNFEVTPGNNTPAIVSTQCWLAYDENNLYFACKALDPDSDQIRAFITDRDNIANHDRISLVLDTFNDTNHAFQFSVSALGVQSDQRNDYQLDRKENSWNTIWNSSGRITKEGYIIEASIPFKSLRFPGNSSVESWRFFFSRHYPRSEEVETRSISWNRNNNCELCQAPILTGIKGVRPSRNIEVVPSITSSRTDHIDSFPDGRIQNDAVDIQPALDAKWGITPNLTFTGTINPDFSQVEADVAQLDVNNRFALFFPETRPFFLEGADIFSTRLNAVFTRTIADPLFGTKITGKVKENSVGIIIAQDEITNMLIPGNISSSSTSLDQSAFTTIARFKNDVSAKTSLGLLYTGRESNSYHNRTVGFDGIVRTTQRVSMQVQYLHSNTHYPESISSSFNQSGSSFVGNAFEFRTAYRSRNLNGSITLTAIDRDFRADAGFIPQVDVLGGRSGISRIIWGDNNKWYSQIGLYASLFHFQNWNGRLTNEGVLGEIWINGPLQSGIWFQPHYERELYNDQTYDLMFIRSGFRIRPTGQFGVNITARYGDAIDFTNGRKARQLLLSPSLELRIGKHLDLNFTQNYQRFSKNEKKILDASISELRTIYNFSTRMFIRGTLQYRSTRRNPDLYNRPIDRKNNSLFSQLLFSYKLNPQTVFFLGYSDDRVGLTEQNFNQIILTQTARTYFVKFSYAFRP